MCVHLPFEVETSFYNEDIIPGYDLFQCDNGFFLHVQCVEIQRVKKRKNKFWQEYVLFLKGILLLIIKLLLTIGELTKKGGLFFF